MHHPGAVGVVPIHDDGTITLVRQYRAALDAEVWEIPAGLRDVDGEPDRGHAAGSWPRRPGCGPALEHLLTFHNSPGFSDEAVVSTWPRASTEVPDDRQGAEEEHMVVARMPLADAPGDGGRRAHHRRQVGHRLLALAPRTPRPGRPR